MESFEEFADIFKGMSGKEERKTIKDIADKYPDVKVVETTCPCCKTKLRLKVKI